MDIDHPMMVFGLSFKPADFVHTDRYGVLAVQPNILQSHEAAIIKTQSIEALIF
jgi:regulator of RNase E activity RraA